MKELLKNLYNEIPREKISEENLLRIMRTLTISLIDLYERLESKEAILSTDKVYELIKEQTKEEPWISALDFYINTRICHPSHMSTLWEAGQDINAFLKKENNKVYVKQEALAQFFRNWPGSRLRNNANKYFELKEAQLCMTQMLPQQPLS